MCGIAGIFVEEPALLDPRPVAERMQIELMHRGPDDRGSFVSDDRRCALAHTRLSILDLSAAGHQPMAWGELEGRGQRSEVRNQATGCARYWIVFNGEIYNYRELREELGVRGEARGRDDKEQSAKGNEQESSVGVRPSAVIGLSSAISNQPSAISQSPWRSNTDTEVILRAYAKWGRGCVNHLRGMFAFAIWDNERQELVLARDPFGIKPLYYYQTDRMFLFASELQALLASGLVPRKISQGGLASYLQFGSVQDPYTMIEGVCALLPGHVAVIKLKDGRLKTEVCRYSNNPSGQIDDCIPASRQEAVKLLRAKLEDSVRLHLVSDVPLGAFLSGGIDSSAIVALMSRVADQRLDTFSVIFNEAEYSEEAYARLVAKKFDTRHNEIVLSEQNLLTMLPNALAAMDQPTMDGINTYVVSKAVKETGVTVALSGLGGDELFAGYPSFRRAVQLHRLATAPFAIRRLASSAGRAFTNGSGRQRKFWDLAESDCSPYAAYAISRQLFSPEEVSALTSDLRPLISDGRPSPVHGHRPSVRNQRDVINEVSRLELTGYMCNTLLRDTDQMSMAHALEVRVPFVDVDIVNYVLALPGEWKMNGGRPKPLLVDALGDLLPEEIWKRPKMGFTLPFQRWMQSALEDEIDQTLFRGDDLISLGLNSDSARSIWADFKNHGEKYLWSRAWALFVLKRWCERHQVTACS